MLTLVLTHVLAHTDTKVLTTLTNAQVVKANTNYVHLLSCLCANMRV